MGRRDSVTAAATAAAGVAVTALTAYFATGQHRRIGATDAEVEERLPGDGLVPGATVVATRAITIDAPVDYVWPWVVQMGQDRGGFYTYTTLENLAGCEIANASRIVPQWQERAVGEEFRLHPEVVLVVAEVEPGHSLVVRSPDPAPDAMLVEDTWAFDFSWAFVVRPVPDGHGTRLLVRERYLARTPAAGMAVAGAGPVSTVLTVGMLRGIRQRAESLFASGM